MRLDLLSRFRKLDPIFKTVARSWGDSEKIFQNTISINIASLSIILAFYIAVSTYFSPQLKQIQIERDLKYNRMLIAINKTIYGSTSKSENLQYYKNDTLLIDKIASSITLMSRWATRLFDNRNSIAILNLVESSNQYLDTLKLISLICDHPILNTPNSSNDITIKQIVKGQDYIPYNEKIFNDIDEFILQMKVLEHGNLNKDISLINYCSRFLYFGNTDSTGKEHIFWAHERVDSLKKVFVNYPDFKTKSEIIFFEECIQRHIDQLSIYNSFYDNFRSIYNTYMIDIYELNYKESLYKNILSSFKNTYLFLILILIYCICIPIILINVKCNGKIALLHFFSGLVLYVFFIIDIFREI